VIEPDVREGLDRHITSRTQDGISAKSGLSANKVGTKYSNYEAAISNFDPALQLDQEL
jgi:hypothetical protein